MKTSPHKSLRERIHRKHLGSTLEWIFCRDSIVKVENLKLLQGAWHEAQADLPHTMDDFSLDPIFCPLLYGPSNQRLQQMMRWVICLGPLIQ